MEYNSTQIPGLARDMKHQLSSVLIVSIAFCLMMAIINPVSSQPTERAVKNCGENEEYSTCTNLCPPTCARPKPFFCSLRCGIGCKCIDGYLRDNNGKCIPRELCPPPPTN